MDCAGTAGTVVLRATAHAVGPGKPGRLGWSRRAALMGGAPSTAWQLDSSASPQRLDRVTGGYRRLLCTGAVTEGCAPSSASSCPRHVRVRIRYHSARSGTAVFKNPGCYSEFSAATWRARPGNTAGVEYRDAGYLKTSGHRAIGDRHVCVTVLSGGIISSQMPESRKR
jgi:hypothetical protein